MEKLKHTPMSDNELIAEFMGGVFYGPDDLDYPNKWWFREQPHESYRKDAHHLTVGLRYDRDWSWLMPVVEKIEKIDGISVIIKKSRCRILIGKKVFSCHTIVKLNSMYRVVVEFIKWHNSQPHKL